MSTSSPSAGSSGIAASSDVRQLRELRDRLSGLTIADQHRLRRRLDAVHRDSSRRDSSRRGGLNGLAALTKIGADIDRAEGLLARRVAAVPQLRYPEELPVSKRRSDLMKAIQDHQVVVVAGETGSGKTTQLPKICLGLGRGVRGTIGHTQPRRIAARAVAERVAEELATEVGEAVGYAVRFTDRVNDHTLVKIMTDGILLAEIQRDRMLRRYDTIIIDEAHERSLNIDFLLGYLQQLLPKRPDLKLIITSATIDPARFASYFSDAPVIEVSGRSYPVEIRYRPVRDPADGVVGEGASETGERDQVTAICDAVTELRGEAGGDILVFLSGEREIRDTAEALNGLAIPDTEVLPLYARLSAGEQHRVFQAHRGRRIVLATNVAETSLTVPGIKYVIDPGTARISRYSNRTKVQLLPIEPISQASAKQRAGRCGRTSDGICIRLYSEDDFDARPQFTDPEILRTNLASVILQMTALDLGSIEHFGFIDPPDRRQIADGLALLVELGALEPGADSSRPTLSALGRRIAQLPLDPRLARMILEADDRGCVRDVLVLAAALSIQDPRERPADAQQAADSKHARFTDPTSDFTTYLNLWRHVREQQTALSSSQFRRMCRADYLNYLRIREWQDLFGQLRQIVKGMNIAVGDQPGDREQIHRSLLAGLLSHIGLKDPVRREYLGARGARFAIFPGSALFKKQPPYVMAAELVDTSRLWGRVTAGIEPVWAEEAGAHLVKRSYSEPHWERRRGSVVAVERVTLYGIPLVVGRKVNYGRVDAELSRELFIRHALVEGDWDTRHAFFHANRALIHELQDLEHRARRRDILVDDEDLFEFYERRIPADVVSARHFDSWWKRTRSRHPDLLSLTEQDLLRSGTAALPLEEYPDRWTSGGFELGLSYRFEPGDAQDGVTVTIPVPMLSEATTAGLDWQVPGLRTELVTALLRSLPKEYRRIVVPIPDTASQLVTALRDDVAATSESLTATLSAELRRTRGVVIPAAAWRPDKLPDHLRPTFRIVDEQGAVLREGKDLAALRTEFAPVVAHTLARLTDDLTREDVGDWDFDVLPHSVQRSTAGHVMTGYPALAAEGKRVAIRVFENEVRQRTEMWAGTRRLLVNTLPSPLRQMRATLSPQRRLALSRTPHGSIDDLLTDCVAAAVDSLMRSAGGPAWDRAGFELLRDAVRPGLAATATQIVELVAGILTEAQHVELALAGKVAPAAPGAVQDERTHLASLIFPGFVTATDPGQLRHLPRFLRTISQRLSDAATNPARDAQRVATLQVAERDLAELRTRVAETAADPESLERIRWMIEELRVSLFAQRLGTAHPVSVPRIQKAMDELDAL